jgi:hypothetical protein
MQKVFTPHHSIDNGGVSGFTEASFNMIPSVAEDAVNNLLGADSSRPIMPFLLVPHAPICLYACLL